MHPHPTDLQSQYRSQSPERLPPHPQSQGLPTTSAFLGCTSGVHDPLLPFGNVLEPHKTQESILLLLSIKDVTREQLNVGIAWVSV